MRQSFTPFLKRIVVAETRCEVFPHTVCELLQSCDDGAASPAFDSADVGLPVSAALRDNAQSYITQ